MTIRVYIVADHSLARVGLASMLDDREECEIVGQGPDDEMLLDHLEIYQPDILVWDVALNNITDSHVLSEVIEAEIPVIALLSDESQASDLWQLGVRGLLPQNTDAEHMIVAMQALSSDMAVIDQAIVEQLQIGGNTAFETLPEALTQRELEVLHLLAEGLSNKAIAFQLGISDHTVKFHVTAIMTKLSAQSRTEAVVRATRLGLIHL